MLVVAVVLLILGGLVLGVGARLGCGYFWGYSGVSAQLCLDGLVAFSSGYLLLCIWVGWVLIYV